jgi:hypothetical protein
MPSWKLSDEQLKEVQLGPRLVSLANDLRSILNLKPASIPGDVFGAPRRAVAAADT